jgi:2'-5' RNA ligase
MFESFDEGWQAFLSGSEPLESFFAAFPEDPDAVLDGWLIEPPREVATAARAIQARLAHLDWLVPVPAHFLHVWIAEDGVAGNAPERWPELPPVELEVRRVSCFRTAVVAEVHGLLAPLLARSRVERSTFLPHLSLAYVLDEQPPHELRDALVPLRDEPLGRFVADEVQLVRVPAGRSTLLQPWEVERTVRLAGRALRSRS